ncbi:MFS transporter [Alloalcanivorax marinus]|uniref:MFS transporter n=1 Tax=Alloalcanivorax marinus TaxID=1177169 RepID=UPI001932B285|nr:MFS transporter [Alloalcanivorax marinus]MBL7250183.1 MFS transporter [Alloalcanivorax marinus]
MKLWISDLNKQERRTMSACFGGWALDAFDVQIYSFVIPTLVAVWGMTRAEAGYLGTVALVFSAVGGAVAGRLSDRIGRVQVLKLTVAWFALFTFLSGFAQNFEQLLVLRALQGLGFGGEWAAGAVLMSEIIRPQYRGRAAGTVHSGFAVGWGGAALVYALVFSLVPQEYAWRCLFWLGILPAFLIVVIRRYVKESDTFEEKAKRISAHKVSALAIFKPPLLRKTLASSLFAIGMQGGYYAVVTWLPTYLKTERNLSVLGTGSYLAVVIIGAFLGFLLGAHCADALGRKKTLMTFGILSAAMVCLYMFAPLSNSAMLILGFPLGLFANAMFAPTGAFYAELFPTELRGTGQGFAYNLGRGVGAFFPALVGLLSATMPLGMAIGIYTVGAYGIAIIALLFLPETQGVALDSNQNEPLVGDELPVNTPTRTTS